MSTISDVTGPTTRPIPTLSLTSSVFRYRSTSVVRSPIDPVLSLSVLSFHLYPRYLLLTGSPTPSPTLPLRRTINPLSSTRISEISGLPPSPVYTPLDPSPLSSTFPGLRPHTALVTPPDTPTSRYVPPSLVLRSCLSQSWSNPPVSHVTPETESGTHCPRKSLSTLEGIQECHVGPTTLPGPVLVLRTLRSPGTGPTPTPVTFLRLRFIWNFHLICS